MIIPAIAIIAITTTRLIHIGDNTHHHDHAINPVSFRPTNNTVNRPVNPIPLLLELESLISFSVRLIGYLDSSINTLI